MAFGCEESALLPPCAASPRSPASFEVMGLELRGEQIGQDGFPQLCMLVFESAPRPLRSGVAAARHMRESFRVVIVSSVPVGAVTKGEGMS